MVLAKVEINKAKYNLNNLLTTGKSAYITIPMPQVIYSGSINFGVGLVKEN